MDVVRSGTNLEVFRDLAEILGQNPRPLVFVGAGLSARAGYPTWQGLLQEMLLAVRETVPGFEADSWKRWRLEDHTWRAQAFRESMGPERYARFLESQFGPPKQHAPDGCLKILAELRFRHYLTTNYDDLIEQALKASHGKPPASIDWSSTDALLEWLYSLDQGDGMPSVVHLHGKYDNPGGIVLTEDDYTERYIRSDQTSRNLHVLFATRRVVFAGFSLADPELTYLLRLVKGSMGRKVAPRHVAILPFNEATQIESLERQRLLHLYGIRPLYYSYDESHAGLLRLLRLLESAVTGEAEPPPPDGPDGPATEAAGPPAGSPPPPPGGGPGRSPAPFDPDDPQKGRWGGTPTRNHRELSAVVEPVKGERNWFQIDLTVRSTDPAARPLRGVVRFHLHPTFPQVTRQVRVGADGVARMRRWAYGAFTVGAEADDGKTHLELDLSELEDAPKTFRES